MLRGRDLRQARVAAGLKQDEAAQLLRIGKVTMMDVERERVEPSHAWLQAAMGTLGLADDAGATMVYVDEGAG